MGMRDRIWSWVHRLQELWRTAPLKLAAVISIVIFVLAGGAAGIRPLLVSHHQKTTKQATAATKPNQPKTTKPTTPVAPTAPTTPPAAAVTPSTPSKTSNGTSKNGTTSTGDSLSGGGSSSSSGGGGTSSGGGTTLQTLNCGPTPHLCGFPDATNTGPVGCSSYTEMTGDIEINDDNTVINCVHMVGSFAVYANNVTIKNTIILTRNWSAINLHDGYSGLKVLHNTITGDVGQGYDHGGEDYGFSNNGSNVEAGWNNISEFGAGISSGNGNIHDNYAHDNQPFIPFGSNCPGGVCDYYVHSDPFISSGGDSSGLTLRHNTFFDQETTEMGASASIGLFYDSGPVSNTTVDDNLMAGGAYCVYPGGGATSSNIVITNNHFSTLFWPNCGVYGPDASTFWHTGGGNVWSGNIWDSGPNAGQAVDP